MKKLLFIIGIVMSLFLVLIPVASAIGGDQGWIVVRCNVDGAMVYFDGTEKGVISGGSLTVPVYTTGAPYHSYLVEKGGYTSASGELSNPSAGATITVYATLNPIQTPVPVNYGSIYVESTPSGASIYFNGNYRGYAPLIISDVWPGSYTIEAQMNGYRTFTTTASVSSGARSTIYCPLSPMATSGSLYIISNPTYSNVALDGVDRGTTPLTLNNLASGTHIVQLDHAGYYDWKSTGWVYISSSPGGASVILDGTNYGQTPSSGSLKLNNIGIGEHTVTLTLSGYQTYSTRVMVYANTVSEVNGLLQPTGQKPSGVGELTISSTPPGANVLIDNNFVGITPLTLKSIPVGSHVVTVELDGYQDYEVTTSVNAGATSTVVAGLSPAIPPTPVKKSATLPLMVCGALLVLAFFSFKKNQ